MPTDARLVASWSSVSREMKVKRGGWMEKSGAKEVAIGVGRGWRLGDWIRLEEDVGRRLWRTEADNGGTRAVID